MRTATRFLLGLIPASALIGAVIAGIYLTGANLEQAPALMAGELNSFAAGLALFLGGFAAVRAVNLFYFAEDAGNLQEPVHFWWPYVFTAYFDRIIWHERGDMPHTFPLRPLWWRREDVQAERTPSFTLTQLR